MSNPFDTVGRGALEANLAELETAVSALIILLLDGGAYGGLNPDGSYQSIPWPVVYALAANIETQCRDTRKVWDDLCEHAQAPERPAAA